MLRRLFLIAGLLLFVYLAWQLGPAQIASLVVRVRWRLVPLAMLYGAYQIVRAWSLHASIAGKRLTFADAVWIRISGEAFELVGVVGPLLTIPGRAWLLSRRGLTTSEGYAAVLGEYLIYTLVSAALSLIAVGYLVFNGILHGSIRAVAIGLFCATAVFLAVAVGAIERRYFLIGAIIEAAGRLPVLRPRFRPDMTRVHGVEDLLLGLLHDRPRQLLIVGAIVLIAHALLVLELFWILGALSLRASAGIAFLVDTSTKFTGVAFFLIPGQVGASEATYAAVFTALGLPAAAGFAVSLVRRLRTLLVAGAGVAAWWAWDVDGKREP